MNLTQQEYINENDESAPSDAQQQPPRQRHGGPFNCARCGRLEYPNGEFQTIKFGDIFTHLNLNSSAPSTNGTDVCIECRDLESSPPPAPPPQLPPANNVIRYGGPATLRMTLPSPSPQSQDYDSGHGEGQHNNVGMSLPVAPTSTLYNDSLNQNSNGSQNSLHFPPTIIQHSFHHQQHPHLFETNQSSSVLSYPNATALTSSLSPAPNAYLNLTVMSPTPNGIPVETKIAIPVQSQSQSGGVITTTKISKKASSPAAAVAAGAATSAPEAEEKPRIPCSLCKKTFKNDKFAVAHMKRVHEKVNRFVCEICGAGFSYRGSLDSHLSSHNPPAVTHDCDICGQKFKEKSNLSKHLRYHTENPKKFLCEHCPSGFSKKVNLRYHIKRKHPEVTAAAAMNNNNSITEMGGYTLPDLLKSPENVAPSTPTTVPSSATTNTGNTKDKPQGSFKCEQCGRGFLFKNNLKAHLKTHSRDKQYVCDLCQKSFIYKESLKNHMLLHSNELPYHCDICGKKFRDRSNRRKHVKNVHKYLFPATNGASTSTNTNNGGTPTTVTNVSHAVTSSEVDNSTAIPPNKKKKRQNKSAPSSEGETNSEHVIKRVRKRNKKTPATETSDTSLAANANVLEHLPESATPTSLLNVATKSVIVSMSNVMEGGVSGGRKVIMSPGPSRSAIISSTYPSSLDYAQPAGQFSSLDLQEETHNLVSTNVIVKTQPISSFDNRAPITQMQNVIVYPNKNRPPTQLHHQYSNSSLQGYDIPSSAPDISSHGQQVQLGQPALNNDYSSPPLQLGHYEPEGGGGSIFPHQHSQFLSSSQISPEQSSMGDRKPNIQHTTVQYSAFYPVTDTYGQQQHWSTDAPSSQTYQQHVRLQDSSGQAQPSPQQNIEANSSNTMVYQNQTSQLQQQSNNENFQDAVNNGSVFLYRDLSQFDFSYL